MEVSDQAVLSGLAVALLVLHVAGSVLVLRTLRGCSHHLERLDELADIERILVRRGTRRGTGYATDSALPLKGAIKAASTVLKDMLKERDS